MADSKQKLFSDFKPITTNEWTEKIKIDLKGADFDKKLVWKTNEGFKVQPFYRQEDIKNFKTTNALPNEFPFLRGTKKSDNNWLIRQDIIVENLEEANKKALDIIKKGVDSIGFKIEGKDVTKENIKKLLKGIDAEKIEINITTCSCHSTELANILVDYFKEEKNNLEHIKGSINWDPIGKMLISGKEKGEFIETASKLIESLKDLPLFRCLIVNANELNNAGAYIYQELGYALAWGNEYLNKLTEAGIPADKIAKRIKFNFGISSNYFLEIAKFRAARMLWADIVKEYNPICNCEKNNKENNLCLTSCKMVAHAITSTFNMTLFDSYVNLLRSQTETMSAALAGVDSISVTPFDIFYKKPDDFSERIARNQQLLLKEESHFNKVVDPAAGSYYIENLTVSIATQAWELFLKTIDEGGMYECVKSGKVQEAVNASNEARHLAVSKRKEVLVGTNQFPNFKEKSEGKRPVDMNKCHSDNDKSRNIPTLNFDRAANQFEEIRIQTESSGKIPKAFMLTIGNLAMRQARAQFSCNFLACAGYEVIDNLGFDTIEQGVDAAMKAKADIVVLCSSDDEYAQYAIPAFKAINGNAIFIVAGAPACMEDLKAAGIENFIHVRCNVLDTLRDYNKMLGIK